MVLSDSKEVMDIDQVVINIHHLIRSLRSTSFKQFSSLIYKREQGIHGPKRNFQVMARTAGGRNQTTSVSPRSFVARKKIQLSFEQTDKTIVDRGIHRQSINDIHLQNI